MKRKKWHLARFKLIQVALLFLRINNICVILAVGAKDTNVKRDLRTKILVARYQGASRVRFYRNLGGPGAFESFSSSNCGRIVSPHSAGADNQFAYLFKEVELYPAARSSNLLGNLFPRDMIMIWL